MNASAYASLAEAVAAVPTNGTVIIDQDTTVAETVAIDGKNVTFNLMGNTLTTAEGVKHAFNITGAGGKVEILNGVVNAGSYGVRAVVKGDNTAEVTIAKDATINAVDYGVVGMGKAVININGTINASDSGAYAVSGNGNASSAGTVFNIGEGAVITSPCLGVYFPQEGTLNISGGTITGATAVYVKGSELNMTGGVLKGTGPKAEFVHGNNGADPTGDALVVENSNYPSGDPTVNITGGEFVSTNGKGVASYAQEGYELVLGFAKGGVYSNDIAVDGLVAEGYKTAKSGKNFKVVTA